VPTATSPQRTTGTTSEAKVASLALPGLAGGPIGEDRQEVAEAVAPVLTNPLRRGSRLPLQILVHPAFLAPATRRTAFPARQNQDRPHESGDAERRLFAREP
jgi:hypothetical protein